MHSLVVAVGSESLFFFALKMQQRERGKKLHLGFLAFVALNSKEPRMKKKSLSLSPSQYDCWLIFYLIALYVRKVLWAMIKKRVKYKKLL